ncbi:MAG: glycosyltransferase family 25 protein [Parachlamydia sp.]|nr:glycosyltransferase family 25 protein [Parachlamydia sp.]
MPLVEHHCHIDHQVNALKQLQDLSYAEMDRDWMLGEYFGSIYVINLPSATDRLEKVRQSLAEVGVQEFEIFSAVDGRKEVSEALWRKMDRNWARLDLSTEEGREAFDHQRQAETGCYLSHLGVIKKVKKLYDLAKLDLARLQHQGGSLDDLSDALQRLKSNSSVLILEDDNGFGIVSEDRRSASLAGLGRLFRKAMEELPLDWDMLYLMAWSRTDPEPFSPHLVKLTYAILMNAYAVNAPCYEAVIEHLEKIDDPHVLSVPPVDGAMAKLHVGLNCFAITPSVAYQREGTSSIIGVKRETYRQAQPD